MSVAAPFGVISNRIRETSYRFQLEMQMEYSLKKNACISSCRVFASDSVSLPCFDNPRNASDKPQTMSGFPSVPSGHCFTDNIKPREPKLAVICY